MTAITATGTLVFHERVKTILLTQCLLVHVER